MGGSFDLSCESQRAGTGTVDALLWAMVIDIYIIIGRDTLSIDFTADF